MSTYVMSDLHGNYQVYIRMLEQIAFQDTDMLYILGDILDRGPNPIRILLDLMERPNVKVIFGNHCMMACECLPALMKKTDRVKVGDLDPEMLERFLYWKKNGAAPTIREFQEYDIKTRIRIWDFMMEFELYDEIEVGGKTFLLVHAGLGNFHPEKELWEYEVDELVWERPDYGKAYFEDKYVITGHTPTLVIKNNPRPGFIYQANHHIAIDCGCSYPGGKLGCLRLEDMQEFYCE